MRRRRSNYRLLNKKLRGDRKDLHLVLPWRTYEACGLTLPLSWVEVFMAAFPIRQAVLEGFGLVRRQPGTIAIWFALGLAKLLIAGAILRWTTQSEYGSVAALLSMAFGAGLAILTTTAFDAVLWAAAFRAFLRPGEGRFAYLRLGNVELCMMGLVFSWALVVGLFGQALAIAATEVRLQISPFQILVGAGVGSLLGTMTFVRFVLTPAVLVDCNRVSLSKSWRLTGSVFLPLTGILAATQILRMAAHWLGRWLIAALNGPFEHSGSAWLNTQPHGALTSSLLQMTSAPQVVLDIYLAALGALGVAVAAGILTTAYQAVTASLEPTGYDQTAKSASDIAG